MKSRNKQKVYIRTFGCQMNKYDSGVMAVCLRKDGYALTGSEEDADVILLNTCSVREHAERRVYGIIGQLKTLKSSNPDLVLGICGCMAQKEGQRLVNKFPQLDLVCGTHRFHEIAHLVRQAIENEEPVIDIREGGDGVECDTDLIDRRLKPAATGDGAKQALPLQRSGLINQAPTEEIGVVNVPRSRLTSTLSHQERGLLRNGVCAWVSVMRGCDSFCSYCVVPYLRGRERSRPSSLILKEVEQLAEGGIKEVTLLGQNIVAYGKGLDEGINFAELLEKVNEVGGILRIRFLTSHPRDVGDNLVKGIGNLDKVCENLHLPLQAGSDKILNLMNRGYTRDYYMRLVDKVRSLMPDAGITTDIIVGFPGETDEDFKETRQMMEEIEFDAAFIYKYSHRPGTAATSMDGQVEDKVKQERLEELLVMQRRMSAEKNKKLAGSEVEVLVEELSKKDSSSLYGRTRTDKNVVFKGGKELIGKLISVEIQKTGAATLIGIKWKS